MHIVISLTIMPSLKFLWLILSVVFVDGSLYRLPNDVVPISYELRIAPVPENETFVGEVHIKVHVKFTTDRIILHSRDLKIGNVKLKKLEGNSSATTTFELDEQKQILVVKSDGNFEFNTDYIVSITFQGSLIGYYDRDEFSVGFYRQPGRFYKDSWAASTHLEATGPRTVFPCFDEPRYRAIFAISLARPENHTAVSNMPSEAILPPDSLSNGFIWEKFQPTPPMPTYLIAFVISEMKSLTSADGRLRAMTRPQKITEASYALKQAEKLLKFFEGYTGIPYSLPKLDIVAVPLFHQGAMENWGLIIYGEIYFLLGDDPDSAEQKNTITTVTSHELAHLWFGDIVTIPWYDYLWLKEGFASYFQYFGPAAIEPSWDMESYFSVKVLQETLIRDIRIQKPMTRLVREDSYDVRSTYDEVSNGKAACVIRMFELMLSPKTFQSALHNYFKNGKQNQLGVTTPRNLFDAFDQQVELDSISNLPRHVTASDIMKTWADNVGYPVINVVRSYDRREVTITQTPFKPASSTERVKNDQKWIVPLTYTTKSQSQFSDLLPSHWSFADEPTILSGVEEQDWVLFNLKQSGYYRVNYDKRNWELLTDQMKSNHSAIHPLNRAQLIDDAAVLFVEGKVEFLTLISLFEYLSDETDIRPLFSATYAINMFLDQLWSSYRLMNNFREYFKDLLQRPFESVACNASTSSSDDHVTQLLKPQFIDFAQGLDLQCVVKKKEKKLTTPSEQDGSFHYSVPITSTERILESTKPPKVSSHYSVPKTSTERIFQSTKPRKETQFSNRNTVSSAAKPISEEKQTSAHTPTKTVASSTHLPPGWFEKKNSVYANT